MNQIYKNIDLQKTLILYIFFDNANSFGPFKALPQVVYIFQVGFGLSKKNRIISSIE